jgi:hypothetical protein
MFTFNWVFGVTEITNSFLEISAEFVKHGGLVYDLAIPHYKPP